MSGICGASRWPPDPSLGDFWASKCEKVKSAYPTPPTSCDMSCLQSVCKGSCGAGNVNCTWDDIDNEIVCYFPDEDKYQYFCTDKSCKSTIYPSQCVPKTGKGTSDYKEICNGKLPKGAKWVDNSIAKIPVKCSYYNSEYKSDTMSGCDSDNTILLYDDKDGRHRVDCCQDPSSK